MFFSSDYFNFRTLETIFASFEVDFRTEQLAAADFYLALCLFNWFFMKTKVDKRNIGNKYSEIFCCKSKFSAKMSFM
jgi:hypothetical protein